MKGRTGLIALALTGVVSLGGVAAAQTPGEWMPLGGDHCQAVHPGMEEADWPEMVAEMEAHHGSMMGSMGSMMGGYEDMHVLSP